MLWGCVTTPIIGGVSSRAPAPPDGMSAQIQSNGVYLLAAPTADMTNATAGTSGPACSTDPPDAGVTATPDASVRPDGGTTTMPDGGNNNNGDGGGCCSAGGNAAGTLGLAVVVALVLSASSSRRRRRP